MELVRRAARWLGARPWIWRIRPAILGIDRVFYRLTRGRFTLVRLAGLPSLILTVTGRKTGLPRMTPLLYVPLGDDCIVTGSNWGGTDHPTWTLNLQANPDATVNIRGRVHRVRARLLTGAERDEVWSVMTKMWPAYDAYDARIARELRVFRLTPAE